ncbi:MAG: tRNA(Ile)(2)-agmatinylcytidine synthase [bacterium]
MAGPALPTPTLLAFDDTDSRTGGCTTHLAFHVLLALPELALSGMPRLVRLNPNVPWKTRGNAAVVMPLGHPVGPATRVGELRGQEIRAFPDCRPAAPSDDIVDRAWKAVRSAAQADAQPSIVAFADAPPATMYWQGVRTRVDPDDARAGIQALGGIYRTTTGRSLVGCLAAAAWPGPASSYEFIAYREPQRWGTERAIRPDPLLAIDALGATFHTADPSEDRVTCVPHGPDPVLLGLRGRDSEELLATAGRVVPAAAAEPVDGWLLWATNQASGDHVTAINGIGEAPEWATVAIDAAVAATPSVQRGGHVHVQLVDVSGRAFAAVAFEPTKALRDVVRGLRPGDRVRAVGAFGDGVARLEKLRIDHVEPQLLKLDNPTCPSCGRSMKSAGVAQGYRCRTCKTKAPPDAAGMAPEPRSVALGWHEVPVMARRHLHRPLAWDA